MIRLLGFTFLFSLTSILSLGCGTGTTSGGGMDPTEASLAELGDLLRMLPRPASKVSDLARYESMLPRAYSAVKSGSVVVLWGTPMLGEGESASGAEGVLIAHEKDAPGKGGFVLMTSGKVKNVSSSQFSSLPRSGKK